MAAALGSEGSAGICLPSRTCLGALVTALAWGRNSEQGDLCGRSAIARCRSSVRLERRAWGEMAGLPQLKVSWGQS